VILHEVPVKRGENSKLPHQSTLPLPQAHPFPAILEVCSFFDDLWKAVWGWPHTLPWCSLRCLEGFSKNTGISKPFRCCFRLQRILWGCTCSN